VPLTSYPESLEEGEGTMSAELIATGEAAESRVLTWRQADPLSPHDVIDRWGKHEPVALHEDEPDHHLEALARRFRCPVKVLASSETFWPR
jgi:hypothetical protein